VYDRSNKNPSKKSSDHGDNMPNNNPKGQRTTPSTRKEKPQKETKSLTKQQAVF
jgi:hypothetical protein